MSDPTSVDHLLSALRAEGLRPRVLEPTLLLSIPEGAELELDDGRSMTAWPATFSRATEGWLEAPLQHADPEGSDPLAGAIAVVRGGLTPDSAYALERRGAIAQVYVGASDEAAARSCSTISGLPTHESVSRKPRTPIVLVPAREGERLGHAAKERSHARLATRVHEAWMRAPLLLVDIQGAHDPQEFVLVHGSDDEVLLTLARACHAIRGELTRSVRVAWWPDRALGSTVGSAWYADACASDIDDWCVAHVSVGGQPGAETYWMSEAAELCLASIAAAGLAPPKSRRPFGDANYSFNQIGVTGLFGGHAFPPSVYQHAVVHIAKAAIYPFDYTAPLLEMGAAVQRYQAAAGNQMDFSGVSQQLAHLRRAISAWRSDTDTEWRRQQSDATIRRRGNATMRALSRVLVPLGYARGERFDHDPVLRFSALPRLEAALHVASIDEPMRSFVRTALLRETNKVEACVREALALVT